MDGKPWVLSEEGTSELRTIFDSAVLRRWPNRGADFTLGVRNLFDKQPPIAMSTFANSFLPTFHRTSVRFLFASMAVKFQCSMDRGRWGDRARRVPCPLL